MEKDLKVGDLIEITGDCRFPVGTVGEITFIYKTDGSYLVKEINGPLEWNCTPDVMRKIDGYWRKL